jgi:hypothetical protein
MNEILADFAEFSGRRSAVRGARQAEVILSGLTFSLSYQ